MSALYRVSRLGDEKLDSLLKRFKRICLKNALFKEMRRRTYYEKPSVRRRKERRRRLAKARKRS